MDLQKPPVKVSPTIKFARWSLLLCGILYGSNKRAVLESVEKKARIIRHEAMELKRQREKEETQKSYKELLLTLGGDVGMEFPPGWEPPS